MYWARQDKRAQLKSDLISTIQGSFQRPVFLLFNPTTWSRWNEIHALQHSEISRNNELNWTLQSFSSRSPSPYSLSPDLHHLSPSFLRTHTRSPVHFGTKSSTVYSFQSHEWFPLSSFLFNPKITGDLNVFFWDSPRLEFEAAYDCDLIISGETFARSGYGLGLQKNSFWSERVTLQLLQMHESGFMEGLDNKWILKSSDSGHCGSNKVDDFQTTLGLETM